MKKKWKIAGLIGFGIGLTVAGTVLWQRYRRKGITPQYCGECDPTGECELCGENIFGEGNVKNQHSKKKG